MQKKIYIIFCLLTSIFAVSYAQRDTIGITTENRSYYIHAKLQYANETGLNYSIPIIKDSVKVFKYEISDTIGGVLDTFVSEKDSLITRTNLLLDFATYDANRNGKVGISELADYASVSYDSERLNSQPFSYYLSRSNHTGTQDTSSVGGLGEFVEDRIDNSIILVGGTKSYNDATGELTITISGGSGSPGGSDNQVQYKSGSSFAGASNVEITSGNLKIDSTATPSAPTTGTIFYTKEDAGIEEPYFLNSDGFDESRIQGSFKDKHIVWMEGSGSSGVVNVFGIAFPTGTYSTTLSGAATSTTNSYTKQIKTEFLKTAASPTNVSFFILNAVNWMRGNAAGEGGWKFNCTFGVALGTSNTSGRLYAGFTSSTSAPTDANPSTLLNTLGFGYDAADANLQFMHNDVSGTATKVDLGSSFPKPSVDRRESYEIEINCRPNSSVVWYKIRRIHTGATASGSVSTDLPASTQFLAPRVYQSNAGGSYANGIALMKLYIETDEY